MFHHFLQSPHPPTFPHRQPHHQPPPRSPHFQQRQNHQASSCSVYLKPLGTERWLAQNRIPHRILTPPSLVEVFLADENLHGQLPFPENSGYYDLGRQVHPHLWIRP